MKTILRLEELAGFFLHILVFVAFLTVVGIYTPLPNP
jgi:hypothetical protein